MGGEGMRRVRKPHGGSQVGESKVVVVLGLVTGRVNWGEGTKEGNWKRRVI